MQITSDVHYRWLPQPGGTCILTALSMTSLLKLMCNNKQPTPLSSKSRVIMPVDAIRAAAGL
jgi:hypothetical protein